MQIMALLCADTLKREQYGTGRSFTDTEQHFILAVSNAISDLLTQNQKENIECCNTEPLILDLQSRLKKIEEERKATLQSLSKEKVQERTDEEGNAEDPKTEVEKVETAEEDEEQDQEISYGEDFEEKEIEEDGNLYGEVDEEEEEEENAEEGSEVDNDKSEINMLHKELKIKKKKLMKLEAKLQNCLSVLEMRGSKASSLQKQLQKRHTVFQDSQTRVSAVVEMLDQVKEKVLLQIRRWLSPPTVIFRIFKALFHLLGYGQLVVDDWMQMRKIVQDSLYTELKAYDVEQQEDFTKWNYCAICIEGITDEMLSTESPIGYLGKQWLVLVKEAISASIILKNHQGRYDTASKTVADAERAKTAIEVELKVVAEEVSRLTDEIEKLSPPDNGEGVPESNETEVEGNVAD